MHAIAVEHRVPLNTRSSTAQDELADRLRAESDLHLPLTLQIIIEKL